MWAYRPPFRYASDSGAEHNAQQPSGWTGIYFEATELGLRTIVEMPLGSIRNDRFSCPHFGIFPTMHGGVVFVSVRESTGE